MSRQRKVAIAIGLVLMLAILSMVGYVMWQESRWNQTEQSGQDNELQDERYITYEGQKYEYNYDLRNILFIGVDKADEFTEQMSGRGGQADALILLSLDKKNKTISLLEISRDSMTDVEIYGIDGKKLATERLQVALQYAYGDGTKRSCQLTKEAVSNLLYGIPIHSYVALAVDGVPKVTELMGGVELTVPEDYTHIDSDFAKGATIVLKGEQAERYVRYRDINVTGSNNQRMERQTQFIKALAMQLQGKNAAWYQQLFSGAEEYITTNISTEEMDRLSKYQMSQDIQVVPGVTKQGEVHDEFVVDNEQLKKIIIKSFYKSIN